MALQLAKMCTKKGKKRVCYPVEPFDTADCSQLSGLFMDALSNRKTGFRSTVKRSTGSFYDPSYS